MRSVKTLNLDLYCIFIFVFIKCRVGNRLIIDVLFACSTLMAVRQNMTLALANYHLHTSWPHIISHKLFMLCLSEKKCRSLSKFVTHVKDTIRMDIISKYDLWSSYDVRCLWTHSFLYYHADKWTHSKDMNFGPQCVTLALLLIKCFVNLN